uniref:Uncharacterized protein n=1 Tax=Plectus sambesii TaxID=2011161 RepID=A0A914X3T6_9BILA
MVSISLLLLAAIISVALTAPTLDANEYESENAGNLKRLKRQGCWPFGGCSNAGPPPFGSAIYDSKMLSKQRSWERSQERRYRKMLSKQRSMERSRASHYASFQRSQERNFRRRFG